MLLISEFEGHPIMTNGTPSLRAFHHLEQSVSLLPFRRVGNSCCVEIFFPAQPNFVRGQQNTLQIMISLLSNDTFQGIGEQTVGQLWRVLCALTVSSCVLSSKSLALRIMSARLVGHPLSSYVYQVHQLF